MINKQHLIADEGNLNQLGRLILGLGEMANTVCCTALDPTTEAHTSLSARALLPSHHLSILHGRIKLYLPPHGKVRDENANVKEKGSRDRHTCEWAEIEKWIGDMVEVKWICSRFDHVITCVHHVATRT
ncbi:hypothetical protein AVEN_152392-1 [Araneus ventricosus]|uniref:Uncharacterized protein n=1 Tax=Araneus ventricosus TaxID=182803 RepID=A0A4Y2DCJ6_ARAVE|nr:hypothetical protein AVEN_152392-1 [Araneus ventricosus]